MTEQQIKDYNEMGFKKSLTPREAFLMVKNELDASNLKFPSQFRSKHEGYAVIKEEIDELWAEIKNKKATMANTRLEAVQAAATLIKFLSSDIMDVES
jgi:hypothetical protein